MLVSSFVIVICHSNIKQSDVLCMHAQECVCVCVCVSFDLVLNSVCSHDILDILTLVNYEVGKGDALIDGGLFKQSPAPMYSLRKKLIFRQPQ